MAALVYASRAPDCPFEIVLVASNDPEAQGLEFARAEGIATFGHSHKGMMRVEFDAILDAEIRKAGAEYVALAGYMRLLSPEFVSGWGRADAQYPPPRCCPNTRVCTPTSARWRLATPTAGCSVHVVTAELDDGPVLGQTRVAILPGDTADTLAARVLIAEHQLYARTLADYVRRGVSIDRHELHFQ
jgi:folate-dependent phosphoribosylglycinamide formyltransferase PurN